MVKYVNAESLEELIANSDKTVYCDFWASCADLAECSRLCLKSFPINTKKKRCS